MFVSGGIVLILRKLNKLLKCIKKGSLSDISPFAGESPVADEVIHVGVPVSNCGSISSDQVTERMTKKGMGDLFCNVWYW